MNISFLAITALQVIMTFFYHIFPQLFPAWALVMSYGLSSFALILTNKQSSQANRMHIIGLIIASLGLAAVMIYSPIIRYIGYGITLTGFIFMLWSLFMARNQKNNHIRVMIFILVTIVSGTLGLVIVPPPPLNWPALFSFMIAGALLALLVYSMLGRLLPTRLLTIVLLAAAFLFSGLEVVLTDSDFDSVLVTIVQSPLHLGVIALMFAHVVPNLDEYGFKRTKNHHL